MTSSPNHGTYDAELSKIFDSENHSVGKFFDAVFGYFSRNSPELIFDCSKHYGKQLVLSNYEKWQNIYLETLKSPVSSSKRARNDFPKAAEKMSPDDDDDCWDAVPKPGPTNTTSTTTISKRHNDNNNTSLTGSKKEKEDSSEKISFFDATNGANLDKYSWTQSVDDLELRVPVEKYICKGNQVKVNIEKKNLKVEVQREDNIEFTMVLEGVFLHPIRVDDCVWLLAPGQHISILLEKLEEKWWDRCLTVEAPIDLKKIRTERDFHSLPEEDKIQIEKVISDKQKEERGEPTSDQADSSPRMVTSSPSSTIDQH